MDDNFYAILAIFFLIGFILLTRAIGAWMLRINEVINAQKETNKILTKILKKLEEQEQEKE
jgi:hypothetical protein